MDPHNNPWGMGWVRVIILRACGGRLRGEAGIWAQIISGQMLGLSMTPHLFLWHCSKVYLEKDGAGPCLGSQGTTGRWQKARAAGSSMHHKAKPSLKAGKKCLKVGEAFKGGWVFQASGLDVVDVYVLCVLSRVQLCNPLDCSPPGSSVHGIFQARILEWVAIFLSRGSSWPRDQTQVFHIAGRFFTTEPPGNPDIVDGCFPKGPEFLLHDTHSRNYLFSICAPL